MRQTARQTYLQTDRQTDRQKDEDRHTDRQRKGDPQNSYCASFSREMFKQSAKGPLARQLLLVACAVCVLHSGSGGRKVIHNTQKSPTAI